MSRNNADRKSFIDTLNELRWEVDSADKYVSAKHTAYLSRVEKRKAIAQWEEDKPAYLFRLRKVEDLQRRLETLPRDANGSKLKAEFDEAIQDLAKFVSEHPAVQAHLEWVKSQRDERKRQASVVRTAEAKVVKKREDKLAQAVIDAQNGKKAQAKADHAKKAMELLRKAQEKDRNEVAEIAKECGVDLKDCKVQAKKTSVEVAIDDLKKAWGAF